VKRNAIVLILIIAAAANLAAAAANPVNPAADRTKKETPAPAQKVIRAVRADEPILIDGKLDEKAWQAPPSNGFIQSDPKDGEPATEKTDVWVAYDDKAIYVAAYCHDSEPGKIIGRLGRRDSSVDSDWFSFAVDPYYDKRTGYLFAVNPAGTMTPGTASGNRKPPSTARGGSSR